MKLELTTKKQLLRIFYENGKVDAQDNVLHWNIRFHYTTPEKKQVDRVEYMYDSNDDMVIVLKNDENNVSSSDKDYDTITEKTILFSYKGSYVSDYIIGVEYGGVMIWDNEYVEIKEKYHCESCGIELEANEILCDDCAPNKQNI